ncbi:MAG: hypothetical protein ACOYVK_20765 [Bacillota bacterium]
METACVLEASLALDDGVLFQWSPPVAFRLVWGCRRAMGTVRAFPVGARSARPLLLEGNCPRGEAKALSHVHIKKQRVIKPAAEKYYCTKAL